MRYLIIVLMVFSFLYEAKAQDIYPKSKRGKYGFVLKKGRKEITVLPFEYDHASDFYNGVSTVKKNELFGAIDSEGNEFLPVEFEELGQFKNPRVVAKKNGKYGVVNLNKEFLIPLDHEELKEAGSHYIFQKEKKYGTYDTLGSIAIEPIYDKISAGHGDFLILCQGENYFKFSEGKKVQVAPSELVYRTTDVPPYFPGCEGRFTDPKEMKECTDEKMLRHLYSNIKYPAKARENGIDGMVVIEFTIDLQGKIKDFEVLRSVGSGCDKESIRVISEMPNWIPATVDGEAVSTRYRIPVRFRLH